MQNKFSFGPSQEDQGRKKTVQPTEGSRLGQNCVWRDSGSSKAIAADSLPTHYPDDPGKEGKSKKLNREGFSFNMCWYLGAKMEKFENSSIHLGVRTYG